MIIKKVYANDFFGEILPPGWLPGHGAISVEEAAAQNIPFGLIAFLSNILRLLTIVAGLYGLFNLFESSIFILFKAI